MLEQPLYDNQMATTNHLFMKTIFLVALASGNRVSELAVMTRISILFSPNNSSVTIPVKLGSL